jgi:uncharacterized PurR-regulated membrane protein YhhQ (DUF165 family)
VLGAIEQNTRDPILLKCKAPVISTIDGKLIDNVVFVAISPICFIHVSSNNVCEIERSCLMDDYASVDLKKRLHK